MTYTVVDVIKNKQILLNRIAISILDLGIRDYYLKYGNLIFESLTYTNLTDNVEDVRKFIYNKMR